MTSRLVDDPPLGADALQPAHRTRMAEQADRDVLQRSLPAYFIYFALTCVFALAAAHIEPRSIPPLPFLVAAFVFGAGRLGFHVGSRRLLERNPRRWRLCFGALALATALTWVAYLCAMIVAYGLDSITYMGLLCSTGLNAGATNTLSPNRRLFLLFVFLTTAPVVVTSALAGTLGPVLAAIVALQLVFHLFEGSRVHASYWRALTNNALLEVRQQTNTLLATAIAHADEAIEVLDADGKVEYVNPAAQRTTGYPPEEVLGRHARLAPEEGSGQSEADLWTALSSGKVWRGHLQARRKDGALVHQDATLSPVHGPDGTLEHHVVIRRDISERLKAERALEQSRRDFRLMIEEHPDAVAIFRSDKLVYANPAWVSVLGYPSAGALIGKPLSGMLHSSDPAGAALKSMRSTGGRPILGGELRFRRLDGTPLTLELAQSQAIEFEGAAATMLVGRDVSERRRLQAQLLLADRMVAVGTLAAGVAHEINNPLAYVMSNLEFLADELRAIEKELPGDRLAEIADSVAEARQGAERVRRIVRDLKTFSRPDDERVVPVDLHQVIELSINMTLNEVRHRARLVRAYGLVPHVRANESRLGQVMVILLVNAAQAIPDGHAEQNEIRVTTGVDERGRVTIAVRDTGVGIAEPNLSRIFEPFFTTKPVGTGTGLGLFICQNIVKGFGGEVSVHSEPGKGSTFRVALLAEEAQPAAAAKLASPKPAPSRGGMVRVLVVDDEPMIGASIRKLLGARFDVQVSTSGKTALDRLRAGGWFDVILCDVNMPEMTGIDLRDALKSVRPDLAERMVFITGGAFTPRAHAFLADGPGEVLEKPFDGAMLRAAVQRWLPRT